MLEAPCVQEVDSSSHMLLAEEFIYSVLEIWQGIVTQYNIANLKIFPII